MSNDKSHTPGPYRVTRDEIQVASGDAVGLCLAKVTTFVPQHRGKSDANARLFAAAPDLLEALKSAVRMQPRDDSCDPWVSDARAAIAKAEGRP